MVRQVTEAQATAQDSHLMAHHATAQVHHLMVQALLTDLATHLTTETVIALTMTATDTTAGSSTGPVMRLSLGSVTKKRNAEEEWMRCVTVSMTAITIDMGEAPLHTQTPIADLPTLTDHLREETMSGRHTYRRPFSYGYLW